MRRIQVQVISLQKVNEALAERKHIIVKAMAGKDSYTIAPIPQAQLDCNEGGGEFVVLGQNAMADKFQSLRLEIHAISLTKTSKCYLYIG